MLALFAAALVSAPAVAGTPSVRLGPAEVTPYVLLQLDGGSTFNRDRPGGQTAGLNLRRARLGAEAVVAYDWQLGLVWEAGGTPGSPSRLFEAEVAYAGLEPFTFAAGVFKPAFTLEYAQSAADLLFLERASIVNIVGGLVGGAGRVVLGQVGASGDRWFAAALVTGGTTGPGAQGDQRALLGRAAGLVAEGDGVAVHLGLSGAWVFRPPRTDAGASALSFSDQPELQVDDAEAPLSTGSLDASGARTGGIEAGLGWGRLWAQGEWYGVGVDRRAPGSDGLFFSGWYMQVAYTLLGTPRRWKPDDAAWGSPKPSGGFDPAHGNWGALEVGARFSTADLNSGDVHGGRQGVWAAGVNWYPAQPLRFTVQYQHADVTGVAAPRSLNAVTARMQLRF